MELKITALVPFMVESPDLTTTEFVEIVFVDLLGGRVYDMRRQRYDSNYEKAILTKLGRPEVNIPEGQIYDMIDRARNMNYNRGTNAG